MEIDEAPQPNYKTTPNQILEEETKIAGRNIKNSINNFAKEILDSQNEFNKKMLK